MNWDDPVKFELAKNLWGLGVSASKIANQLGSGVTRNAVVGIMKRWGVKWAGSLPKPPQSAPKPKKRDRRTVDLESAMKQRIGGKFGSSSKPPLPLPEQFVEAFMVPKRKPENLFEAIIALRGYVGGDYCQCRYSFGQPGQEGFHFCEMESLPTKPYCAAHSKLCTQPPRPR